MSVKFWFRKLLFKCGQIGKISSTKLWKYKLILLCLLKNPNRLSKYGPGNFPLDGFTFAENHRVSEEFPKIFKKYFPKALTDLNKLHEA